MRKGYAPGRYEANGAHQRATHGIGISDRDAARGSVVAFTAAQGTGSQGVDGSPRPRMGREAALPEP